MIYKNINECAHVHAWLTDLYRMGKSLTIAQRVNMFF